MKQIISYSQLWSIQEPLLAMAAVIEAYIHYSNVVKRWRDTTADWWVSLKSLTWTSRFEINQRFVELFDAIYGAKTFSWRRIIVSFFISTFLLLIFYFLFIAVFQVFFNMPISRNVSGHKLYYYFGFRNEFVSLLHPFTVLFVVYDSLGTNFLPDFISVAETGLILKWASKKNSNLISLFIFDLFLTTSILVITHLVAHYYHAIMHNNPTLFSIEYLKAAYDPRIGVRGWGINTPEWWALIATTYSTSILWIFFIINTLFIGFLKRSSRILCRLLESNWTSKFPIVLTVGIPCLICWPILFILRFIFL